MESKYSVNDYDSGYRSGYQEGYICGETDERVKRFFRNEALFKILFMPIFLTGLAISCSLSELYTYIQDKSAKQAVSQYKEQVDFEKAIEAVRKDSPTYTGYEIDRLPNNYQPLR